MDYCLIENGMIVNMIVCPDDDTAAEFGAVPSYNGAAIGQLYAPPHDPEPAYTADDLFSALLGTGSTK